MWTVDCLFKEGGSSGVWSKQDQYKFMKITSESATLAPALTSCGLLRTSLILSLNFFRCQVRMTISLVCCEDWIFFKKGNHNAFRAQRSVWHTTIVQYVLGIMITLLSNLYWLFREEQVLSGQILYFSPSQVASSCYRKKAKYDVTIQNEETIWHRKHKYKRKIDKLDFVKIKLFCFKEHTLPGQWSDNPWNRKNT